MATVATSPVTFMNVCSHVIHICGNVVAMFPNNRPMEKKSHSMYQILFGHLLAMVKPDRDIACYLPVNKQT